MPIDGRQSHSNIVKELLDEYKSTGKIGNTTPKDVEHARKIANAIAYKVKDECILDQIRKINEKESNQLSFDFQNNINTYLQDIAKKNEVEISDIVNKFMRAYLAIEKNRLKFLGKQIDLPQLKYNASHLIRSSIDNTTLPIGYSQRLGALNARSAEKAAQRTNHFYCMMHDSDLIVRINSEYIAEIKMTVRELGG